MSDGSSRWDRLGICASTACTIHCLIAPFLFLLVPKFASIWAHPASHALVAVFVVPMALGVIRSGYRSHGKKWVMASAAIGIAFIVTGSILPYVDSHEAHVDAVLASTPVHDEIDIDASHAELALLTDEDDCEDSACHTCGSEHDLHVEPHEAVLSSAPVHSHEDDSCVSCCPQVLVDDETGETSLVLPPASIVTVLGSFFLVAAHIGNLIASRMSCRC